ncbi:hypothetical protein F53441_10350 [Fusarium austroafricanum]|uniref:Zn(2)-C6 fungal-type domain-containing protein n=1 Tax=Fusarium austroafricanum TaxID=2364996 RepID=A0A8H4K9P2_9HYPO|nr:hypothetical protein F53441_10350 [Fusarium austroafricanum]
MVNTGKPSRGCATCKKRKIKCDELTPTCTQCKTAGWSCPGPSEAKVVFRNQTSADIARKSAGTPSTASTSAVSPGSEVWKRPVSPPVRDRATTFFMRQYVFDATSGSATLPFRDNHEFLPGLIRNQQSSFGLLSTTVAAAGFAALSNAGNVSEWRAEAFRLYDSAIRQLQTALQDPVQRISDETLGAVLLMGTFESIAFSDPGSLKASSQHIIAAARCIEMRGPSQFQTVVGLKMFMQMRRVMITTCHQLQEPIPFELAKWSRWAEGSQQCDLVPVNRFSEINEQLAGVRAELKYQGITDPAVIADRLLKFDRLLQEWAVTLPPSWEYKSYRSIGPNGVPSSRYNLQHDMYTDPWIACIWNCYRNVRLVIHESIIIATLKHGTPEQKGSLQSSAKALANMADGICHSVAYHLGYRAEDNAVESFTQTLHVGNNPIPGGFLLLWPLFFAGIQRTSSTDQRQWVGRTIRQIGLRMGLQLAASMADLLLETEIQDLSFSNCDTFFIGEWYPN